MVYEPKKRWEADEALAHAYFDPVRDLQQSALPSVLDFEHVGATPPTVPTTQSQKASRPGLLRPAAPPSAT